MLARQPCFGPSSTSAAGVSSAPENEICAQPTNLESMQQNNSFPADCSERTHALPKQCSLSGTKSVNREPCNEESFSSAERRIPVVSTGNTEPSVCLPTRNCSSSACSQKQMQIHNLASGHLQEASSFLSSVQVTNKDKGKDPVVITVANSDGSVGCRKQSDLAAQSSSGSFSAVVHEIPIQNDVSESPPPHVSGKTNNAQASIACFPKPAFTETNNSTGRCAYMVPMTAEEYFISAQETAIAVSKHSAYSFSDPLNYCGRYEGQSKSRKKRGIFGDNEDQHKHPRWDFYDSGEHATARILSASEKSSEMGTENGSVNAPSDFGSENASDSGFDNSAAD